MQNIHICALQHVQEPSSKAVERFRNNEKDSDIPGKQNSHSRLSDEPKSYQLTNQTPAVLVLWATGIQRNRRKWITPVSFLSNEAGGNGELCSRMRHRLAKWKMTRCIHHSVPSKILIKLLGWGIRFQSVWGHCCHGYKNGLEKGAIALLSNDIANKTFCHWKAIPWTKRSRDLFIFFHPLLIYDGPRWDYWSSSKWEVPPHVFWMSRFQKLSCFPWDCASDCTILDAKFFHPQIKKMFKGSPELCWSLKMC